MLSCVRYRHRLCAYLDGAMNQKEYEAISAHLARCAGCQKRLEDIRSLEGFLNGTLQVPPVPNGLSARIMAEGRRRQPVAIPGGPSPLPV